ncbi:MULTISPECIES: hypothetical protein [Oceanobacillus]|uniref:DUF4901 domain-containing protein n=1 Tax=Oceanobacillus aidingensis TaxID=645964 RepID=A0ABV9JV52_9BACI|nr:hypothetical protein [Oceanobacillus oncorhynchi]MDM8098937.1 hypothetical protein [Oceanobacillus oncorhynchi]
MHPAAKQIIETTREQFQLTDFYLESYDFLPHEANQIHLSMTWIPNGLAITDDLNPNGTVVIAVDIKSKKLTEIIFVGKENRLSAELFPQVDNMESMIEWIEEQTQLEYGRQFKLVNETKEKIVFHAAVDNIRLFPGGTVTISFNEEGMLSSFYVHGMFADESQIQWEPFNLVDEVIYPLAMQHCKLIEVPDESTAAWKPYYVISSFLVSNQNPDTIIYFDQVENNLSYTPLDTILTWEEPSTEKFEKKEIDLKHVFTEEEAFQKEKVTDNNLPIPDDTAEKMVIEITNMLQKEFPNDSGRWRLTSVKRERGYLLARLDPATPTPRVLYPSLKLLIHPETLQVDNYVDTEALLDAFDFLADAEAVKVDVEAAAGHLCEHIEVEPVYVYDNQTKMYQLCGKVTSGSYAIDAVTGELSTIDE